MQSFLDKLFDCPFELAIIEATLIVVGRDDSVPNLIDLKNRL